MTLFFKSKSEWISSKFPALKLPNTWSKIDSQYVPNELIGSAIKLRNVSGEYQQFAVPPLSLKD